MLLKFGLDGRLDLFDFSHLGFDTASGCFIEQGDSRAGTGGVSGR
jgi:hypothetical protein